MPCSVCRREPSEDGYQRSYVATKYRPEYDNLALQVSLLYRPEYDNLELQVSLLYRPEYDNLELEVSLVYRPEPLLLPTKPAEPLHALTASGFTGDLSASLLN